MANTIHANLIKIQVIKKLNGAYQQGEIWSWFYQIQGDALIVDTTTEKKTKASCQLRGGFLRDMSFRFDFQRSTFFLPKTDSLKNI